MKQKYFIIGLLVIFLFMFNPIIANSAVKDPKITIVAVHYRKLSSEEISNIIKYNIFGKEVSNVIYNVSGVYRLNISLTIVLYQNLNITSYFGPCSFSISLINSSNWRLVRQNNCPPIISGSVLPGSYNFILHDILLVPARNNTITNNPISIGLTASSIFNSPNKGREPFFFNIQGNNSIDSNVLLLLLGSVIFVSVALSICYIVFISGKKEKQKSKKRSFENKFFNNSYFKRKESNNNLSEETLIKLEEIIEENKEK